MFEVVSWDKDGKEYYTRRGSPDPMDLVESTYLAEVAISGFIKFDGGSEFTTDHLNLGAGRPSYQGLVDLLRHMWPRACELMQQAGGHMLCIDPRPLDTDDDDTPA